MSIVRRAKNITL